MEGLSNQEISDRLIISVHTLKKHILNIYRKPNGILLVADEVQTGFGRSGKMFVSEYWKEAGCAPDIMTSAKSIAAGAPLSDVTARAEIMDSCRYLYKNPELLFYSVNALL